MSKKEKERERLRKRIKNFKSQGPFIVALRNFLGLEPFSEYFVPCNSKNTGYN